MPETPSAIDLHIGARFRVRRRALGLSQTNVADVLGCSFQHVQRYEKGQARIPAAVLWPLATLLKVDANYFFKGLDLRAPLEAETTNAAPLTSPPR